ADHLTEVTQKRVSLTSVHMPLSRLEQAGLIVGEYGEATAKRGGRRKKIYRITKLGTGLLDEHKRITELLWGDHLNYSSPKK
ncbi:hypothetical protein ACFLT9_11535, partial [Acidobacteriota bacterium]